MNVFCDDMRDKSYRWEIYGVKFCRKPGEWRGSFTNDVSIGEGRSRRKKRGDGKWERTRGVDEGGEDGKGRGERTRGGGDWKEVKLCWE